MTSPPSVPSVPRFAGAAVAAIAGLVAVATLATLLGLACAPRHEAAPPSEPPPQRSFYYWRTVFRLSQAERAALQALQIRRLYVRLFDVTWDSAASAPTFVGDLTVDATEPAPEEIEFIPVVFLRHEVLQKLDEAGVRALSVELWRRIEERTALLPGLAGGAAAGAGGAAASTPGAAASTPGAAASTTGAAASTTGAAASTRELQIDCDWTDGTRDRFFALLTELRRLGAASAARRATPAPRLSATIRLHQVKYRERTGVPPVERGMLMFYNMGRFSAEQRDRAIFDAASADKYLARLADYPLPLDLALPIWSWTLHLRDGEVLDLLQSTDPQELADVAFLRRSGHDRYVATDTAFFRGALLREGDELKGESLSPAELSAAVAQVLPKLAPAPSSSPRSLALFDLSERNLRRHDSSRLEQLFVSAGSRPLPPPQR